MTSLCWKALFENMGTTLKFSSLFHPQIDGQSEEANSTVLDLLKCYVSEHKATCEHYLPFVEYAYNNTVHTSTGKAPFEIVEGGKKVPPILRRTRYLRQTSGCLEQIYDDTDLEFGLMRLQTKGGPTTNNGVKSVIDHLKGCRSFPRLRIGIGSVPGTMDPGAFVLQRFHEPERGEIDELIARVPVLIREMVTAGIEKTASSWNEIRKSRMLLTSEEKEILQRISSTAS
ncbi:hypothetical protein L7F22_055386 [Adiantum nelumboides]|nr:hypothetical protein [Adiantum nelumboides]